MPPTASPPTSMANAVTGVVVATILSHSFACSSV